MSLRYTGEATMDEPALRDVERWKDKIEVRLDNRQVFFLFFGSAMVACMLFVLGVIVGKRLETRGRAEAPAIEDPLAVLDRFGVSAAPSPAPAALTFPRALTGGGTSAAAPPPKTKALSTSTLASTAPLAAPVAIPVALVPAPAPTPAPVAVAPTPPPVTKKAAAVPRPLSPMIPVVRVRQAVGPGPAIAATPATAPVPAAAAVSQPTAPRAPASVRTMSSVRTATKEPTQPVKLATSSAPKTAAAATETKSKGRFLLQLSSFQDRGEADAFARRFTGQSAYVVATEIPGKGTWYRVRVGSYGSLQEATVAKTSFERDHNVIAYVAGGGPANK